MNTEKCQSQIESESFDYKRYYETKLMKDGTMMRSSVKTEENCELLSLIEFTLLININKEERNYSLEQYRTLGFIYL